MENFARISVKTLIILFVSRVTRINIDSINMFISWDGHVFVNRVNL